MFDYYELKFVFHGADCKRRAADMDEARAAKKELQAAGVKEITIFGVKKGTKEIQAAKKEYVKPEFKHEPAPKAAKTPQAAKVPAKKKKAAQSTKKQSTKKANRPPVVKMIEKAAENFEKYKVKKDNDVNFGVDPWDEYDIRPKEKFTFEFSPEELGFIENALNYAGEDVGFKSESKYIMGRGWTYSKHENLLTTISNLKYEQKPATLELDGEEMALITRAIDNLINIQKSGYYKLPLIGLLNSLTI